MDESNSGTSMGPHAHHEPHPRASDLARAGNFLRHLGEMILAMVVGMAASIAILVLIFTTVLEPAIRGLTRADVLSRYPVLICLVMAAGMTVPMVAWMRHRGHDWRVCSEMAAAMIAPLLPIFGLLWLQVIRGDAACGLYCAAMVPAMVVAMLFRLDLYTMGHAEHMRHMAHAA